MHSKIDNFWTSFGTILEPILEPILELILEPILEPILVASGDFRWISGRQGGGPIATGSELKV